MSRRDTVGLLPTGGGKSLCYQLAGLILPGTVLVVDPIISLMIDQVTSLKNRYRIDRAVPIHSGAGNRSVTKSGRLRQLLEENVFVFLSPERFQRQAFRDALSGIELPIAIAVIDEGHCVSMWGHDFRPSYIQLAPNIRRFCRSGNGSEPPPILALTGTASQLVLIDLTRLLGITDFESIIRPASFDRPELNYHVIRCPAEDKNSVLKRQILPRLADQLGVSREQLFNKAVGIIFDYTPNKLWKLMSDLDPTEQAKIDQGEGAKGQGLKSRLGIYTGKCPNGTSPALREKWENYKRQVFEDFNHGRINCLLGNNAVSVGIDNDKIRYVINMTMPQSLEGYYQQAGRAGRDDKRSQSFCYLLFSEDRSDLNDMWFLTGSEGLDRRSDIGTAAFFHGQNFPGERADVECLHHLIRRLVAVARLTKREIVRIDQKTLGEKEKPLSIINTERFVGYLIILGLVEDYTIEGMAEGTVIVVTLNPPFYNGLIGDQRQQHDARNWVVECLNNYYSRYSLIDRSQTDREVREIQAELGADSALIAAATHLIRFLYARIAYQRRMAIRDITQFCRETINDPVKARERIKNYFDRSKFSGVLMKMQESAAPDFNLAQAIFESVVEVDEAEHLFWETSRLLSEQERADWLAVRICAGLFLRNKPTTLDEQAQRAIEDYGEPFLTGMTQLVDAIRKSQPLVGADDWLGRLLATSYRSQSLCEGALSSLQKRFLS